ncbi:putative glucan endo-1,3-beta-D-glucosidase [Medicago truncatula]|uniref:glucan endo-1,3-beta-D-glucosidase n=1 Tax=Medicago truncatula TaxID=3880 RepID=G7JR55_MEDTR|nr:glucan endo-1,3-beta-glucosidase 5 [Medicago truncatula]AES92122.2 glucan endo-1,3-beta-glucosidase-like protein [Medicago truncatula]RHN64505.1 putative glucan endo-1,3-beta-D-glucosidase [Medicago truncatula]
MGFQRFSTCFLLALCILSQSLAKGTLGFACNWGTITSHPLPAQIMVKLMRDNGINKVKLFEADPMALKALGNSGIQVMVGIPNDLLDSLATNVNAAIAWVDQNVSAFISKNGVDIRYVAVGNEAFLKTYNGRFVQSTFPAIKNIQAALIKAGLGRQVKVTTPLNADVYQSDTGLPSGGHFRPDIQNQMMSIIKFLSQSNGPLTFNIYPFLSLDADPNFPKEFAFFDGSAAPVVDGSITYTNVFDANFDTLISALEKNGFGSMNVIIGEVGWPTDGTSNANIKSAQRFNQGLVDRIVKKQGTPKRPTPPEIYMFALLDEDLKSIDPGPFERHWGIFNFDGSMKYPLNLGGGKSLVGAKGVKYLAKQWCVISTQANVMDPNFAQSMSKACTYADCTSLAPGSSCSGLDTKGNASYAFNMYYQRLDQRKDACQFNGLSVVTNIDPSPSQGSCHFEIMIDIGKHETKSTSFAAPKIGLAYKFMLVSSFSFTLSLFI